LQAKCLALPFQTPCFYYILVMSPLHLRQLVKDTVKSFYMLPRSELIILKALYCKLD
jgi:hypothetical protein